jgi:hypothetical protein
VELAFQLCEVIIQRQGGFFLLVLSVGTCRGSSSGYAVDSDGAGGIPWGTLLIWRPERLAKFGYFGMTNAHIYLTAGEVAILAQNSGDQGDIVLILAYTGLRGVAAGPAVATVADALSHAYRAGVSVDLD